MLHDNSRVTIKQVRDVLDRHCLNDQISFSAYNSILDTLENMAIRSEIYQSLAIERITSQIEEITEALNGIEKNL